jgi:pyridoxal phosphate enzyme (YggS family)
MVTAVTGLAARIGAVRARVDAAARAAGRDPRGVRLLLAVKGQDAATLLAALAAGAHLLGHNRAQELAATAPAIAAVPHEMHFIGHLQSNKVAHVLPWVTCVESLDGELLARRLDRAAAAAGRTLDVLVQVNTSGEVTKSGVPLAGAPGLAAAVGALPHLRLRGFMTIGALSADRHVVRRCFDDLAAVRAAVVASGAPGTAEAGELSMGMSGDLEEAVAAGSTIVRVGSAVFGPRP